MKKRVVALFLTAALATAMLAGCGSSSEAAAPAAAADETEAETETETVVAEVTTDAESDGAEVGFTEYPIFEDEEVGFLNLSAVYFQPVPMQSETQTITAEDFDIHLEADISALENNLGFGVGDWVPYLTVDYDVIGSDGESAASGTFMTMSASDGPHYGANIALPNADTYSVKITIHSPGENGYLIHADSETGPGGLLEDYFGDGPLTYTFEGWDYTPQEW
ncbi:MAG: iron transporter [Lachnospiraceae bacterium]|nr:iron transporter [Lachnospiraceae bacterium]